MPDKEPIASHLEMPKLSDEQREQTEKKYQQRLEEVRVNLEQLYDDAQKTDLSPIEILLADTGRAEGPRTIYGDKIVDEFLSSVRNIKFTTREEFVHQVIALGKPMVRARFYDPEVQKRINEFEEQRKVETVPAGKLEATIHTSDWNFSFSREHEVTINDKVLEISWPDQGEVPKGLDDIRNAFKAIAEKLKEDHSIKAVLGVSWMMSHPVMRKLGFEIIRDIDLRAEQVTLILYRATAARKDKPYKNKIGEQDVKLGVISREDFIEMYG